jgi:antitoxin ParD1/3/4
MRAAVRALDREEAVLTEWLKARVGEAFADPRPNRSAQSVFKRIRSHHAAGAKARRNEKI